MSQFSAPNIFENWSLQAIVKGSSGDFSDSIADMDAHDSSFLDGGNDHDRFFADYFPQAFEIDNDFINDDQLGELCKPFYPVVSSSRTSSSVIDFHDPKTVKTNRVDQDADEQKQLAVVASRPTSNHAAYTPKYKKRKNQNKRVVKQVYAEELGSDMWAWRKYGQKPIKGSPYPRSYYRCSSSKACLARKLVEQSYTDPGMYIITYNEEHNHVQPTRRNSLAGTVRQKFPSAKSPNNNLIIKQEKHDELSTSSSSSPPNILEEWEFNDQARIEQGMMMMKKEEKYHDETIDFSKSGSDMLFKDDFFSGLEDFEDFVSEMYTCNNSAQQFPVRYYS